MYNHIWVRWEGSRLGTAIKLSFVHRLPNGVRNQWVCEKRVVIRVEPHLFVQTACGIGQCQGLSEDPMPIHVC